MAKSTIIGKSNLINVNNNIYFIIDNYEILENLKFYITTSFDFINQEDTSFVLYVILSNGTYQVSPNDIIGNVEMNLVFRDDNVCIFSSGEVSTGTSIVVPVDKPFFRRRKDGIIHPSRISSLQDDISIINFR